MYYIIHVCSFNIPKLICHQQFLIVNLFKVIILITIFLFTCDINEFHMLSYNPIYMNMIYVHTFMLKKFSLRKPCFLTNILSYPNMPKRKKFQKN